MNNNYVLTFDDSDSHYYTDDEDEVFNTKHLDTSLTSATANYSKSLNDISMHDDDVDSIPMRPNSLAISTDDHFIYNDTYNCNIDMHMKNNVST